MDFGHRRQQRQGGFKALLLLAVLSIHATVAWAAGPVFVFEIPAGDAQKTLQQFYSQSKIELLYLADSVRGTHTNAVSGQLDASTALGQMLRGTSLEFTFEDDFSFVSIRPRVQEAGTADPDKHADIALPSMRSAERDVSDLAMRVFGSDADLEQVVITGTLIPGVFDIISPLEFVTRREMRQSSYATVQDALNMLPVNMGGGPSEDFPGVVGNFGRGSGVNLRGLGTGATLVLVNGRRQPYSGTEADFVDLSGIPWSAVDHIEVLPDGASALYGSDAIAGVVNVIMRKDLDGAETQVRFGAAPGGAEERLVAQLYGTRWDSGNALFSYQFSNRGALDASARAYTADSDKRNLGGTDHRSTNSSPGNILDPRTFLPSYAIPQSQNGTTVTASDLLPGVVNLQNQYTGVEILPERQMHSAFMSLTQEVGDRLELFSDARFNDRRMEQDYIAISQVLTVPSSNAFFISPYPGARSTLVSYSFRDSLGPLVLNARTRALSGTFGGRLQLSDTWKVTATGTYGRETMHYWANNQPNALTLRAALADSNPATAFNVFGGATNPDTLAAISQARDTYSRSGITTGNLTFNGTLFELPSGPVQIAVGGEWRQERLMRQLSSGTPGSYGREVESGFAEIAVPIIGKSGDPYATPRLELSLAGRYESYSDFGSSSDPKVGLRWAPTDSVKLRTSWGTSFKAPKLVNVYDTGNNRIGLATMRDPKSPTGASLVLAVEGNNQDLKQETASTWTAGIDLAPPMLSGLKLSLTYYAIDYNNRILQPGPPVPVDTLVQESQWASIIDRNPLQSVVNAACQNNPLFNITLSQCQSAPVAAIVDLRVRNMASTRVRGLDMKLEHSTHTRFGQFDLGLDGGYVFSFRQASSSDVAPIDVVNTVGNPLAFRMRATGEWYQRGWDRPGFGLSAAIDRFGGYNNAESTLTTYVRSFTTLDMRASYRTTYGNGVLDDVEIGLNASNVFNTSPPFVDSEWGYDAANTQPYGRVLSLTVQKNW